MLHNLDELGFKTMTPVQEESLPHILNNCDVLAQAKTGSGKTAAFGIGLLTKLDIKKFSVQALVLCPTRELADQVAKELRRLAREIHNVKILTLCGGVALGPQYGSLMHGAHIIVGTPGRVLKHLDKESLSLKDLDTLVLDEADRMLDMGFIDDIKRVINYAPKSRQTLLFSATYSDEIMRLSSVIQKKAINIHTVLTEEANKITEYFYETDKDEKLSTLIKIISHHRPDNVLVFSNTKIQTEDIADGLCAAGIDALALHGDLDQYQRADALVRFTNKSCAVLVATDVAARGLDIKELDMVVNFDIAHDEIIYTHRIGRTGRAGKEGVACTLFTNQQAYKLEDYQNDTRKFENADSLKKIKDFKLFPPNITLVLEAGKKDKIRPGDIMGALTGDAGIEGKYIGKIDVNDRQSYIAINRLMIKKAHSHMIAGKVKGKRFSAWILTRDK